MVYVCICVFVGTFMYVFACTRICVCVGGVLSGGAGKGRGFVFTLGPMIMFDFILNHRICCFIHRETDHRAGSG